MNRLNLLRSRRNFFGIAMAGVTAAAAVGLTHTSADAAVTLVGTSTAAYTPGDTGPTSLNAGSYAMSTGNALVVSVAARHGGGGSGISATFAGQVADYSFIEESGDRSGVGTFLFLNPTITSGDIVADLGTGARAGVVAYELSNVVGVFETADGAGSPGVFSESGNGNTTVTVNYEALADAYVVHTMAAEGPATGGFQESISGDNVDVTATAHDNGDNGRFLTAYSAGGSVATTDTFATSFSYYRSGALSSVVFYETIPEPASLALVGLGGLALLGRQRRHG